MNRFFGAEPPLSKFIVGTTVFLMLAAVVYFTLFLMKELIFKGIQSARYSRGVCGNCAYDLTGIMSGTCPECGTPIPNQSTRLRSRINQS